MLLNTEVIRVSQNKCRLIIKNNYSVNNYDEQFCSYQKEHDNELNGTQISLERWQMINYIKYTTIQTNLVMEVWDLETYSQDTKDLIHYLTIFNQSAMVGSSLETAFSNISSTYSCT